MDPTPFVVPGLAGLIAGLITAGISYAGVLRAQRSQEERDRTSDQRRLRDAKRQRLETLYAAVVRMAERINEDFYIAVRKATGKSLPGDVTRTEEDLCARRTDAQAVRIGLILESGTKDVSAAYERLTDTLAGFAVAYTQSQDALVLNQGLRAVTEAKEKIEQLVTKHLEELEAPI